MVYVLPVKWLHKLYSGHIYWFIVCPAGTKHSGSIDQCCFSSVFRLPGRLVKILRSCRNHCVVRLGILCVQLLEISRKTNQITCSFIAFICSLSLAVNRLDNTCARCNGAVPYSGLPGYFFSCGVTF